MIGQEKFFMTVLFDKLYQVCSIWWRFYETLYLRAGFYFSLCHIGFCRIFGVALFSIWRKTDSNDRFP
jgi:hypothetical protein